MTWSEVFIVLLVCHLAGDFILQTEWQALHKFGGLGRDPERRRALVLHVTTYSIPIVAALVLIGLDHGAGRAGVPRWPLSRLRLDAGLTGPAAGQAAATSAAPKIHTMWNDWSMAIMSGVPNCASVFFTRRT